MQPADCLFSRFAHGLFSHSFHWSLFSSSAIQLLRAEVHSGWGTGSGRGTAEGAGRDMEGSERQRGQSGYGEQWKHVDQTMTAAGSNRATVRRHGTDARARVDRLKRSAAQCTRVSRVVRRSVVHPHPSLRCAHRGPPLSLRRAGVNGRAGECAKQSGVCDDDGSRRRSGRPATQQRGQPRLLMLTRPTTEREREREKEENCNVYERGRAENEGMGREQKKKTPHDTTRGQKRAAEGGVANERAPAHARRWV